MEPKPTHQVMSSAFLIFIKNLARNGRMLRFFKLEFSKIKGDKLLAINHLNQEYF